MAEVISSAELFGKKNIVSSKELFSSNDIVSSAELFKTQPKPKKGLWDRYVEATGKESEMMGSPANLETLRTVVAGGAAWIPAGIIKSAGIVSGQREDADELANVVQEKIVGTPSTDVGKLTQQQISAPFEKLSEKSQEYADIVYDKTGSPIWATATRVAGEAIPFVAPVAIGKGLKAVRGAVKAPEIDLGKVSEKPTSITPDVSAELKKALPKEEVKAPEVKVKPVEKVEPAADPLITEARKYKTAEEFVKAQGEPVYHGTKGNFDEFSKEKQGTYTGSPSAKEGFFFSRDSVNSKHYAGVGAEGRSYSKELTGDNLKNITNEIFSKKDTIKVLNQWGDNGKIVSQKSLIPMWPKIKAGESSTNIANTVINEMKDALKKAMPKMKEADIAKANNTISLYENKFKNMELTTKETVGDIKDVYLNYKNPMIYDDGGVKKSFVNRIKEAKDKGYDAVIFKNTKDPHLTDVTVVFEPNQIKTKADLTSIWNKAQEGKGTPKAEMPVEGKPAKAALDINKELVEKGFEGLPDNELARYNTIQKVEEVGKVQQLVSNPDFFEMAKGNKPLPEDVHPQVLFNVAINEATKAGNIDMLMDLAKSPIAEQRSLAAQQLGASGWEKPTNNIVKAIQEVKQDRESKIRSPQIKEKVRKVLNEEVKKINLSKEELSWDRFLSKIEC